MIQSREIKPETEKEHNPINIDPIILTPVALIDLYLLGNILGALGLRRKICNPCGRGCCNKKKRYPDLITYKTK